MSFLETYIACVANRYEKWKQLYSILELLYENAVNLTQSLPWRRAYAAPVLTSGYFTYVRAMS
jgi:hypothetical protein